MNHRVFTVRAVFERERILELLDEPEFEDNFIVKVMRDHPKPKRNEQYLAIFVYNAESQGDGTLLLRPISTTIARIKRYTAKKWPYYQLQGIYLASDSAKDGLLSEMLRAHYRARQEEYLANKEYPMFDSRVGWTKNCPNGAGDFSSSGEIVIDDPDVDDLNTLFNLGKEGDDLAA